MLVRNLLLAVGIVALLVGIALAVVWIQQSGSERTAASVPVSTQTVLVAANEIRPGTLLRREDMAWKAIPTDQVPPAAIRQQPDAEKPFLGAVARRPFAAGEAIVPSGLVKPGERGFLAAVLNPGMRAVSIAVDAASSAAGLVQPGDYVDVILAQNLSGPGQSGGAVSETVLQNVRVIAVDQWFSGGSRGAPTPALGATESRIPKTVTLEVNEGDAKRLLVAGQLGKLTLVIRALTGAHAVPSRPANDTEPVWASDVSAAMGRGPAAQHTATGAQGAVRILRGSKAEGP